MRKIGILLGTITVFAIVGSTLAFKARGICYLYVHDANDARISACTKQLFQVTLTPNATPLETTRGSIASTTAACPILTIYKCD